MKERVRLDQVYIMRSALARSEKEVLVRGRSHSTRLIEIECFGGAGVELSRIGPKR